MKKIKKNDNVIIITGKDKGKIGIVKKMVSKNKVIVKNINMVIKHQKPIPSINQPGNIIRKELPIDISNIAIFNKDINKLYYVKFIIENIKKFIIFKSNGKIIK